MSSIKTPEYLETSDEKEEKNRVEPKTLYLVATPIGNLSDLSPRAVKVLSQVDFVAAEDTRNSAKLLACFDIHRPLVSYFEHNKRQRGEEIVSKLEAGESCALITDAGMPAISDPGEDLVRLCGERGIRVIGIPGCCAAVTALALSGLPTGKFVFEGFLSTKKSERRERLDFLRTEERTIIFYEAPHKLRNTLDDFVSVFGADRKISLCRELTKRNEETMRTTVGDAVRYYAEQEPRGEYVLIVAGCDPVMKQAEADWASMSEAEHVAAYLDEHPDMKTLDAIKAVAKIRGVPRNDVYRAVLDCDTKEI
ncbi:MAG: 16S rRNA (cytidine(1402)-2'-O)-methyltransferase [Eubacteriales bacterium]